MQESPGPRHRSTLSTAAHKRLTETINGVSDQAARSGMAVIYAHQDPGRATKVLSRLRTGGPYGCNETGPDSGLRMVSELRFPKRNPDAFSNHRLDRYLRAQGIYHLFIVGFYGASSINGTAHSAPARA